MAAVVNANMKKAQMQVGPLRRLLFLRQFIPLTPLFISVDLTLCQEAETRGEREREAPASVQRVSYRDMGELRDMVSADPAPRRPAPHGTARE